MRSRCSNRTDRFTVLADTKAELGRLVTRESTRVNRHIRHQVPEPDLLWLVNRGVCLSVDIVTFATCKRVENCLLRQWITVPLEGLDSSGEYDDVKPGACPHCYVMK